MAGEALHELLRHGEGRGNNNVKELVHLLMAGARGRLRRSARGMTGLVEECYDACKTALTLVQNACVTWTSKTNAYRYL